MQRSIGSLALCLAAALALTACEAKIETSTPAEQSAPTVALPDGLALSAAPANTTTVAKAKADAKGGDTIVIRGRVGGLVDPFVAGRAVLTLADDDAMAACDEKEGDGCPNPWDYCCETPETISGNTLTVQVVGEDGRPLKTDLAGFGGLKPGSLLVVQGTVAERSDPKVLIVNATGIFVE